MTTLYNPYIRYSQTKACLSSSGAVIPGWRVTVKSVNKVHSEWLIIKLYKRIIYIL